ncbi:MAG: SLC45 family MFS transporter, partial [Ruminococcaceae bacterium]|nr:SLC45 family MFS transporter [Oscillospiraceae bacterium]
MKLDKKQTFLVGLAFMSIIAFWEVYDNVIPVMLKNTFGFSDTVTGAVMGIDNVLALFMLPFFGALSDRTKTRIGRRMPYIVGGTLVTSVFVMLLPIAQQTKNLTLFMIALGVVLLAMSTYRSPAVALMPDVTPKPLRSKANAIINLMGALGGASILVATALLVKGDNPSYVPLFIFLVSFMLISVAVLFFTVNEPKAIKKMREISRQYNIDEDEKTDESTSDSGSEKMAPDVRRSFVLILISIFLWFMGYNAVISGFTRYAAAMWGRNVGEASTIKLVATVAAILSYIPVGLIASKFGRKKTIILGICFLAVAFGSAILFPGFSILMFIFFAMAGMGWALINVNSYPMVVEMSKGANIGKYTGYYYIFSMAAQTVTPMFSGIFIDLFGYKTLFPYGSIFVLLSLGTMMMVKHG